MNKINIAKAVLSLILGYILCILTIWLILKSGLISLAINILLFLILYLIIKPLFGLAAGILGAGAGVLIIKKLIECWLELALSLHSDILMFGPLTLFFAFIIYHLDRKKTDNNDSNEGM